MIGELRTLLKLLGPGNLVRNARRMKVAREPIRGYVTTQVYWALMKVGFIDQLADGKSITAAEFCHEQNLDQSIMEELCTYLVRLDHLSSTANGYSMTKTGLRFWQDTNGVMNIFCAYQPFFQDLEAFLRKEASTDSRHRLDERVALGFRETGASFTFAAMSNLLKKLNCTSIVELGCGNIDLSLFACHQMPELRCLGIDFDERFLSVARQTIDLEGLSDRVSLIECDLFELQPSVYDFASYDVVTAIDLFHGYYYEGREKLLTLFRALRSTFPKHRFLVSEICLADQEKMRNVAYPMVEHELFHSLTQQQTFVEGELEELLAEAGFKVTERWSARNLAARIFLQFE